jgi:hypothetical protein
MSAASAARRRALTTLASEHPIFYQALCHQARLGAATVDQARRTALTQLGHLFPGRYGELNEQETAPARDPGSRDGATRNVPWPGRGGAPASTLDAGDAISLALLQNRYRGWRVRVRDSGQWVAVRPGTILIADNDYDLGRQLAESATASAGHASSGQSTTKVASIGMNSATLAR